MNAVDTRGGQIVAVSDLTILGADVNNDLGVLAGLGQGSERTASKPLAMGTAARRGPRRLIVSITRFHKGRSECRNRS